MFNNSKGIKLKKTSVYMFAAVFAVSAALFIVKTPVKGLAAPVLSGDTADGDNSGNTGFLEPIDISSEGIRDAYVSPDEFFENGNENDLYESFYETEAGEEGISAEAAAAVLTADSAADIIIGELKNRSSDFYVDIAPGTDPSQSDIDYIIPLVFRDGPDTAEDEGDYLYWNMRSYRYTRMTRGDGMVRFVFSFKYNDSKEMNDYVAYYTAIFCEQYGLNSDLLTDQEKIKAVYDYLAANVSYDKAHYALWDDYPVMFTAYGALHDKTALCQGYSLALYRILRRAGIPVRVISGYGNNESHGWNIVGLGGKYYNIDVTWDATLVQDYRSDYNYFLKNETDFSNHTRDARFSTAEFYQQHPMAEISYPMPKDKNAQVLSVPADAAVAEPSFALSAVRESNSRVTLSWDFVTGGSRYDIYNSVAGREFNYIGSSYGNTATLELRLPAGGEMQFFVNAVNALNSSAGRSTTAVISCGEILPAKGEGFAYDGGTYKITKAAGGNITASVTGYDKSAVRVILREEVPYDGHMVKVTGIDKNAFSGMKKLSTVTIPATVTSIGANAFKGCKKLSNIDIKGKKLKSVGKNCFKGCKKKLNLGCVKKKKKKYTELFKKGGASSVKYAG